MIDFIQVAVQEYIESLSLLERESFIMYLQSILSTKLNKLNEKEKKKTPLLFKLDENEKRSTAIQCLNCYYPITHCKHLQTCITVGMWQFKIQQISLDKFKPMMTYGLNGCTAVLGAQFNKNNGVFSSILLVHDPSKDIVRNKIQSYLYMYNEAEYVSFIIIRTPIEYDDKYIEITENESYWEGFLKFKKTLYSIEPYDRTLSLYNNYNNTLHCNMKGGKLQYSTTDGLWQNIEDIHKK